MRTFFWFVWHTSECTLHYWSKSCSTFTATRQVFKLRTKNQKTIKKLYRKTVKSAHTRVSVTCLACLDQNDRDRCYKKLLVDWKNETSFNQTVEYLPSWHATLFQRPSNVIWTLWTLDGRWNNVVCQLGKERFPYESFVCIWLLDDHIEDDHDLDTIWRKIPWQRFLPYPYFSII